MLFSNFYSKHYLFINAFVCMRVNSLTMIFHVFFFTLFPALFRIKQVLFSIFPSDYSKSICFCHSHLFSSSRCLAQERVGAGRCLCCCWVLLPAEISIDCRPWESAVEHRWQTVSAFKTKVLLAVRHFTICVCVITTCYYQTDIELSLFMQYAFYTFHLMALIKHISILD